MVTRRRPAKKKQTARPATKGVKTANKPAVKKNAAKKTAAKKSPARRSAAKKTASKTPVDRLREICAALPEVTESEAWGEPTFRVRNKIFAMHSSASTHHGKGREAVWIAAQSNTQDLVLRAKPDLYFSPPYVGPFGWIGAWIDRRPVWSEIVDFLRDAYRMKATKKQIALLGED